MADSDSTLELLIRVLADTKGADAVQSALNKTKDSTALVAKSTEEAGEQVKSFNVHGREMHELLHKTDALLPGLGHVLKAALNPEAAGIIGLVLAIELLLKLFEKMKRDAEEFNLIMAQQPDLSGISNSVESIGSAFQDANRKAQDFLATIREIVAAKKTIAEVSEKEVAALEQEMAAQIAIAKAKKEQVAAELELMKQKGQISQTDYDLAKIQLEAKSAREAAETEVAYLNKEKEQMETDRATAAEKVKSLSEQEKTAQDRVAAADNNVKQAEQRLAHAKTETDKVTEQIRGGDKEPGLQRQVDDFRQKMYSHLDGMTDAELSDYFKKIKGGGSNITAEERDYRDQIDKYLQLAEKLQQLRTQQSGFAGKMRSSEGDIETAKDEKSAADEGLRALNKEISDNSNSVKTLAGKLDALGQKLDAHRNDNQVFDAQDRARRAQALPDLEKSMGVDTDQGAAAFVQKYLAAISEMNHGKGTANDTQLVGHFVELNNSTKESDHRLFLLIQDLVRHKGDLKGAIDDLHQQLGRMGRPHM